MAAILATVLTGSTTTVNVSLQVGQASEIITVTGTTAAAINYESNTVQGVVTRGDHALAALRGWLETGRPKPPGTAPSGPPTEAPA